MASRIRLYDRTGTFVREVSASAFREWVINDIGTATFTIKAAGLAIYIQFGNYITIEHDTLGTWVGLIVSAPPLTWSAKIITVNAKSAMWLFAQRRGSIEQPLEGSWGEVFSQVLGLANAEEQTLLRIGTINEGIEYSSVVDLSNMYTYLQRALAQANARLDFRPEVENGRLSIYIDMQPALYTVSDLALWEGLNIKKNASILAEQGEIYNDVTILGIGLDQTKFTANARNAASIEKYGLRQIMFSEGTSQSDVDRLALVRLAYYAFPRKTLNLTVIDQGNTFSLTRIGAIGQAKLFSVGYKEDGSLGFEGDAYIRTLQFDDRTGEAVLICQEILT